MPDDRQCSITVSLMVVTINKGVASIVFFYFSKDSERREAWEAAIRRDGWRAMVL